MNAYEHALYYSETLTWKLVRIPPRSKNPTHPGWNKNPTPASWWIDHLDDNMGVILGQSNIVSLDIDNQEYTRLIFYTLGLDYDKILDQCPRILGRVGHDKALFRAPVGIELKTHKLAWDETTIFEFRAGAVQDVLPPSIHPDTGLPYTWKRGPDLGIPDIPKEILAIWVEWQKFKPQLMSICPWATSREIPPLKPRQKFRDSDSVIEKYNTATDISMLLERYGYIRKGAGRYLRPGSTTGIPGVIVFPKENRIFSHHAGEPFDPDYSHDPFDLFCVFEHAGNVAAAVKAAKKEIGIVSIEYDPAAIEHGKKVADVFLKKKLSSKKESIDLLSIPGRLQDAVDFYNETALKPQPEFAVASALAIGSICLARQWRSDQNNYTGLYFLLLGKSSTGKEHSKTVIEQVLRESGDVCLSLIGPPGYTSAGAIISTLKKKPRHICIQDEMGKQLQNAMSAKNSQKDAAYTMIMEAFGRQAGFLSSDAYSTLSSRHADEEETSTTIDRPSIVILGISTPSTLYKAINVDSIASGYLPRFLIIESREDRSVSRWVDIDQKVPTNLRIWCRRHAEMTGTSGNLSAYMDPPEPVTVPFAPDCRVILEEFESEIIRHQNELDTHGIAELWGRVKEMAMRISLIVAVSCESDIILPSHLMWAINYVRKHMTTTTNRVRGVVSSSDFEAVCKDVAEIIRKSGVKGATQREIYRSSHLVRALTPREVDAVMAIVQDAHGIQIANISHTGAGRPRVAWIYPESEEQ